MEERRELQSSTVEADRIASMNLGPSNDISVSEDGWTKSLL